MHVPQSVEAATELREIAAVPKQLISPRLSKPLVSVVQDTLVGVNRLTRPTEFFTRREFMNLLVHSKRWDGRIPPPAKTDPVPLWSGKQVVSALLPSVYLAMGNKMWDEEKGKGDQNYVVINNGNIENGILDGDVFDKALIHILYNDFSPEMTVDFLDSLQAVVATYLQNSGFSVGLSDLIADQGTLTKINTDIDSLKKNIESIQLQVHMGLFDNASGRTNQEEFEGKIFQSLDKAISSAGKTGLKSLSANNRMVNMVKCGSKGSDLNIAQMIALLGQQSIEGRRIAYGFQDRTLPHFKRYDDGAESRGFIESSFVKGLNPAEFFFHAMTGREGLIDTAVKTADSGYMQRQLVKTMEDLTVFHDGSVRDAGGLLVQFAYGDDGTSATKIENQPIRLAKMSDAEIRAKFSVEDVGPDKSQEYLSKVFEDRDILVNNVWGKRVNTTVQSAVHIPRLISNAIQQLGLAAGKGTPVPGAHILSTIDSILQRTRSDNRLWAALLRYHLNPRDLQGQGFTRAAFDWLAEQIVVKHMKSWVVPGEMAGIISAQSLGEPTTQMTLNSVDWNTEIVIAKNGEILTPKIGEFIDDYIKNCDPEKIQYLENEQIYVPLEDGNDWSAISCDENGKMMWTKLEAITKHPVVNEDGTNTILEVTLESGRIVRATKGKSFLTMQNGKLVDTNGSDLKVGDELPITNDFAIDSVKIKDTFNFRSVLPATEFLYGTEVQKALVAMRKADVEGNRHWYSHANGKEFTVPYGRSDAFRDAYTKEKNGHAEEVLPGFVYPKKIAKQLSQIPETIPLDREFGFFMGMFVAEGSTSPTQIQITNNDDATLAPIRTLLDKWKIGHHTVSVDKVIESTGIKGHTTSLIIHSTLLTAAMKKLCGRISYEKTFPNWVLQAPDDFVKGFVDGYFTGDGYVGKDSSIHCSSVSEELITNLSLLLSRYGIFTTHSSYVPNIGKFKSVSRQYQLALPPKYSVGFAKQFTLTSMKKQERLIDILANENRICKRKEFGEVVMDKIKTITEIEPVGGKMFDLTVEKTRNFVTKNRVGVKDTFHLSGVSAKSGMTRGVPRLKELLKVSQNPKATSLTIPLRTDIRTSKEDARRLAQELEFTMLRDLVTTSRIYYDPRDDDSLIAEDKEWLSFFAAFEQDSTPASDEPVAKRSPWILRLELDREKMFNKNITMEDLNFILKKANTDMEISYTDHNASRMIVRVRVPTTSKELDDLATIKQWQNKLLTSVAVRGLPGLRSVTFRKMEEEEKVYEKNTETGKYEAVEQFVMDTFGTNLLDVMTHPDIDGKNVLSNHVYEVYENLGIEAARQILFKEIYGLFEQAAPVNYRHVALLCDTLCCRGRMTSADRYGVAKKKNGPLAKASFEQTGDIMLKAAVFGEMDAITGVSANIMTGQPIRGGTSFSQVLLDESAMQEFMTSAPPPRRAMERAPRLVQAEIDQMLDAEKAAPGCRQEDLRIPVVLPPNMPLATVTELPELEINLIDE